MRSLLGSDSGTVLAERGAGGLQGRRYGRDLLSSLVWADREDARGAKTAEEAASLVVTGRLDDARRLVPWRLISIGEMRATAVDLRPVPRGPADRAIAVPVRFESAEQRWILIDLDDLDPLPLTAERGAKLAQTIAGEIARTPGLSGRCAVTATSYAGMQIWAELSAPAADARAWSSDPGVRAWYLALGARLLALVRSAGRAGGVVDASALAPGRFGRRPGWRLLDGRYPYRVPLLGVVLDPGGAVLSGRAARQELRVRSSERVRRVLG